MTAVTANATDAAATTHRRNLSAETVGDTDADGGAATAGGETIVLGGRHARGSALEVQVQLALTTTGAIQKANKQQQLGENERKGRAHGSWVNALAQFFRSDVYHNHYQQQQQRQQQAHPQQVPHQQQKFRVLCVRPAHTPMETAAGRLAARCANTLPGPAANASGCYVLLSSLRLLFAVCCLHSVLLLLKCLVA